MREKIPEHVLIVWNTASNSSIDFAHSQLEDVLNNLTDIISFCQDSKIRNLTIHVFPNIAEQNTVGWAHKLAKITDRVLLGSIQKLPNEKICVRITGDLGIFSNKLVEKLFSIAKETNNNDGLNLNLLINYGGKQEILSTIKMIIHKNIKQKELDEELFRRFLLMPDLPDPDLEIITGGDYRVQDSLIWQSTYAEMCVSEIPWFAYRVSDFMDAIGDFANRERRFGVLPSQI